MRSGPVICIHMKYVANSDRLRMTNAYIRPESLAEATKVRAAADSRILCGGTDFYTPLGTALPKGTIVDLTRVAELDGIEIEPNQIRIGACTSWTKLVATPLPQAFDGLKAAAREVGSIQIQNRATIGGNLCNASPAADGVPPLLALDAEVELASAHATRRLRLNDFILGNRRTALRSDEILSAVIVPRRPGSGTEVSTFAKLGSRHYLVISIAMVAVNLVHSADGRVAGCEDRGRRLLAGRATPHGA